MFHHLARLLSQFCLFPISPGRTRQRVKQPKSKSTQPMVLYFGGDGSFPFIRTSYCRVSVSPAQKRCHQNMHTARMNFPIQTTRCTCLKACNDVANMKGKVISAHHFLFGRKCHSKLARWEAAAKVRQKLI